MTGLDTFTDAGLRHGRPPAPSATPSTSTRKTPKTRDRYKGVEQFLTARRLVEAGVGCVTLSIGGWDTHGQNFKTLQAAAAAGRRGIANLIQDLHDRGMHDDVVTVMWGEFGRTPQVNSNAGRDHWSPVMSALVAGGGLKMGQAIGTSTARGEHPKDRPVHRAAGAQHALPRHRHRPGADVPQRQPAGRCTSSTTASRSGLL